MAAFPYSLQGDVTGLVDMNGALVVQYDYTAGGRPIEPKGSLAGTLGKDNPFRYRGYVYDDETGLYYLRSRYYSAGFGRFINADTILGTSEQLLSCNIYIYCNNQPITRFDPDGKYAIGTKNALTFLYSETTLRTQGDKKKAYWGIFSKISILNYTTKMQLLGDNKAGIALKSVTDSGTATTNLGIGETPMGIGVIAKAKASIYSARGTVQVNLLGYELEVGLTVDAGSIGGEVSALYSIEKGIEVKASVSALVGGGFTFRIKQSVEDNPSTVHVGNSGTIHGSGSRSFNIINLRVA
jgi:RHS repeat-associated protein